MNHPNQDHPIIKYCIENKIYSDFIEDADSHIQNYQSDITLTGINHTLFEDSNFDTLLLRYHCTNPKTKINKKLIREWLDNTMEYYDVEFSVLMGQKGDILVLFDGAGLSLSAPDPTDYDAA